MLPAVWSSERSVSNEPSSSIPSSRMTRAGSWTPITSPQRAQHTTSLSVTTHTPVTQGRRGSQTGHHDEGMIACP